MHQTAFQHNCADGGYEVNYGVASIPTNTGTSVSAGVMDRFMCFDHDYSDEQIEAIKTFFDYFYDDARYSEWVLMEGFLPATQSGAEAMVKADPSQESWISILDSCKFYPTAKAEWQMLRRVLSTLNRELLMVKTLRHCLMNFRQLLQENNLNSRIMNM